MLPIFLSAQTITTIQGAIDSATAGDTINIPSGTYAESLTIDKSISLLADTGVVLDVSSYGIEETAKTLAFFQRASTKV